MIHFVILKALAIQIRSRRKMVNTADLMSFMARGYAI